MMKEIRLSPFTWADFKTNSDGLMPVISQDYRTGQVLILAYMNEESYRKTLTSGLMCYWSRSRKELWTKGETSGNLQYVRELYLDCDNDTILAKVIQIGPACHTGRTSCFYQDMYEIEGPEVSIPDAFLGTWQKITEEEEPEKDPEDRICMKHYFSLHLANDLEESGMALLDLMADEDLALKAKEDRAVYEERQARLTSLCADHLTDLLKTAHMAGIELAELAEELEKRL